MNRLFPLICLVLLCLTGAAHARMYQWVDPDSGTTQLSGKPPAWYRSGDAGPRVFVFDKGRVIDDTGIPLPETQMERLRQEAFLQAVEDRQQAMEKLLRAKRQKAALELKDSGEEVPEEVQNAEAGPLMEPETPAAAPDGGPTADEMRALIEQYELMRTQTARQLVEDAGMGREDQPPAD